MMRKTHVSACAMAVFALCLATTAFAQTVDRRTFFTFSGQVEVPGATLPAGKYLFRLPAPTTSHSLVQVLSADSKKVYGTFFSIPIQRVEASSKPEISFMEMPAGMPPPIKTWWQAGERTGFEFIYPRQQARRLAKAGKHAVLTTKAESTKAAETSSGAFEHISESGNVADSDPDDTYSATGQAGRRSEGEIASAETSGSAIGAASKSSRRELPRTASLKPVVGLAGILALFGSVALCGWRRRVS